MLSLGGPTKKKSLNIKYCSSLILINKVYPSRVQFLSRDEETSIVGIFLPDQSNIKIKKCVQLLNAKIKKNPSLTVLAQYLAAPAILVRFLLWGLFYGCNQNLREILKAPPTTPCSHHARPNLPVTPQTNPGQPTCVRLEMTYQLHCLGILICLVNFRFLKYSNCFKIKCKSLFLTL